MCEKIVFDTKHKGIKSFEIYQMPLQFESGKIHPRCICTLQNGYIQVSDIYTYPIKNSDDIKTSPEEKLD